MLDEHATGNVAASSGPRARYPCSAGQRRFWLLDRIDPGNPALNVAVRWRLEGRVSSAVLEQAFARIIERHQPLRTSIVEQDGEPVQRVEPFVAFHIPEVDLTGLAEEDAFAEAERVAQLEARASFDLSVAPLIRVTHLRVREDVSIVLVTAHHIVCDAWSMGIMAREMGAICAALDTGQLPALPDLPVSYGKHSLRRAQRYSGEARARDEDYWRRSLQELKPFELQPDRPRPPVQTSNGAIASLQLDRDLTQGLLDLSRRSGTTLFTTTLAALFALLHRYTGETDIAVGSPVYGRDEPGVEDTVGLFIDTIVLRGDLSGNPTFAALLARVQDLVVDGHKHLGTPLDRLIEMLEPKRDLSRNALFSIKFALQNSFVESADYGSFRLVDMPSCFAGTLCDLNFFMVEKPAGWTVSCEYNTDLFEPETVARLLEHFANLLRAAVADPAQPISTMAMLDATERRTLIADWNRSATAYPAHSPVSRLFEIQAQHTPESVAVICGEQSLCYRELDRAANRLAQELRSRGIGRTSRVGVFLERSPDLVVALLAVLKSGAAYVPLDPGYPPPRLAQILDDARPAAVLTTLATRARLPATGAPLILLDAEAAAIARQPDLPPDPGASPEDVAYVIYTSGSTGRPKGVQIQHRALTNLLWAMRSQPGLAATDTLVSVTTVSFDIAGLEIFLPLIVGARLVVAQDGETADGAALLRLLRRHRATVMQATPVTWRILLAAGWHADPPLKMLCGGEALPRTLADQLLNGGELWNMYGPTETTIWSSALRVEPGTGPVPMGPPIANTQFYVLDAHGQLAPTGAPGELFIGGDGVALGYLNLPEQTRERFVPDTFGSVGGARLYRTGDRVRLRQRGRLEFLGRTDHQVKLRGFRIELGEIESVLRAQPQVADCVATTAPDRSGEHAIHAYVVATSPAPGQAATLVSSLRASLHQALPAYMCPSTITVLDAMPRTPNGKVDRGALPAPALALETAPAPRRPASPMEERLAKIWGAVLGIPDVNPDANFFEIGGHSLLAVRLLARIETELGAKLSLATLFRAPTIAGQAKLLARGDPQAFDFRQVVKLQPNGSRPPLIAINNTGIYYALSRRLGLDQPFTSLQLFDPSLPHAALPRTLEEIAAGYAQLIRRVQRDGPYALLGWCVAGTLAFEVARQLTAAGQRVSQLFLFDTLAPGHLKRLPWRKSLLARYAYRWKLITADWRRTRSERHPLAAFLANRTIVKQLAKWFFRTPAPAALAERHDRLTPLSPEEYDQWLLRYLEDAAANYEPKPYPGTMTLFRSSAEPAGRFLDPKMGWGEFVQNGIDVAVIDGDHFSIFQEPSVSRVAQRIESAMSGGLADEARAGREPAPLRAAVRWRTDLLDLRNDTAAQRE